MLVHEIASPETAAGERANMQPLEEVINVRFK